MNPHQRNKVDISALSPEEQRLFRMYGKLPNKKDLLQNKLKERKYFDSGDYALSKAGKASDVGVTQIGREHPNPETIPHLSTSPHGNQGPSPPGQGLEQRSGSIAGGAGAFPPPQGLNGIGSMRGSGSPVKESSFLHREQSIDDQPDEPVEEESKEDDGSGFVGSVSPPAKQEGMPIRGAAPQQHTQR